MEQHSLTPWRLAPELTGADGKFICDMMPENAAHIVRCVNAHDDLVAALEEIVAMTDEDAGTFRKRGGTYRGIVSIVAAAALAKATEVGEMSHSSASGLSYHSNSGMSYRVKDETQPALTRDEWDDIYMDCESNGEGDPRSMVRYAYEMGWKARGKV